MMLIVNRSEQLITGSINGKPFAVTFDEKKYEILLGLQDKAEKATTVDELRAVIEEAQPLTEESYKDIVETMCPYVFVNKSTNKFYLQYNGVMSSKPLPHAFAEKLIKSVEKQIDITPLVKCWVRFLRCPVYSDKKAKLFAEYISALYTDHANAQKLQKEKGLSQVKAMDVSTTTQVSITKEGLLVCYKVSREVLDRYELNAEEEVVKKSRYKPSVDPDTGMITYAEPDHAEDRLFLPACMGTGGDEFFSDAIGGTTPTKGHFIRVGRAHWLEKEDQINANDGVTGVPGLHVGGLNYIAGFQQEGTVTHNIFVDPMDIRAIVGLGQGNDGAMRVKRYFVYSTFEGVNKNLYHSSSYAALTDAEYAKMVEEAVTATAMKKTEADAMLNEQQSLSKV